MCAVGSFEPRPTTSRLSSQHPCTFHGTAFLGGAAGAPERGGYRRQQPLTLQERFSDRSHSTVSKRVSSHVEVAPTQVCALVTHEIPQRPEQIEGSVTSFSCFVAQVCGDHRERGLAVLGLSAERRSCAGGHDAPLILVALAMLVVMAP